MVMMVLLVWKLSSHFFFPFRLWLIVLGVNQRTNTHVSDMLNASRGNASKARANSTLVLIDQAEDGAAPSLVG
jgi:uncharacterized membrane-anchored protein